MTIAAFEGRSFRVGDIPSAYLQADHVPSNGKPVHIVADTYTTSLIVEAMPEYRNMDDPTRGKGHVRTRGIRMVVV